MGKHSGELPEPLPIGDGAVLRRWRDEDAPAVVAASNDPELARWIPVPQPYTLADAEGYIANTRAWWRAGHRFVFCVDRGGEAVGSIGLRLDRAEAAIGYWLAPAARGAGLMTRAVEAVIAWAGSELGITEFTIHVQAENVTSCAVAERADFVRHGVSAEFPDGKQRFVYRRRIGGEEQDG